MITYQSAFISLLEGVFFFSILTYAHTLMFAHTLSQWREGYQALMNILCISVVDLRLALCQVDMFTSKGMQCERGDNENIIDHKIQYYIHVYYTSPYCMFLIYFYIFTLAFLMVTVLF